MILTTKKQMMDKDKDIKIHLKSPIVLMIPIKKKSILYIPLLLMMD